LACEELGQNAIEWSGVLVLVAIIAAGIMLAMPQLSRSVQHGVTCAVDKILDTGGCGATATPPPTNVVVCETTSATNDISDQVQVFFLQVGHDSTLIKTVYSNGQVGYTLTDSGSVEAQAKLFQLEAEAGPLGGVDAQITAAAGGQLTGSHTFMFPNQQAATGFSKQVQSAGGWGVVVHDFAGSIPGVGGLVSGGLGLLGIHGAPSGSQLAQEYHQYETGSYVGVGGVAQVDGSVSASLGPLGGQLQADLKTAGGARDITSGPEKGDVALYLNLSGDADSAFLDGVFGPSAASAAADGTAVVTLNSSGQPVGLELDATASAGAGNGVSVKGKGGDGDGGGESGGSESGGGESGGGESGGSGTDAGSGSDDDGPLLKDLDFDSTSTPGTGYLYTANVDLAQDPNAVSDLLGVLEPGSASQGLANLESTIGTYGTQQVQPFHQSQNSTTAGVSAEAADVGGGVSATQSSSQQAYTAGWIKPEGSSTWEPTICQK
jgi:hypothetical protein